MFNFLLQSKVDIDDSLSDSSLSSKKAKLDEDFKTKTEKKEKNKEPVESSVEEIVVGDSDGSDTEIDEKTTPLIETEPLDLSDYTCVFCG